MPADLKSWSRRLKSEIIAINIAARDPRTPRMAKFIALVTVAYALSPVDLIPDFIPVLGQLDDLILVPLGLWLALRLVPREALGDARIRAQTGERLPRSIYAAACIGALWIASAALVFWFTL